MKKIILFVGALLLLIAVPVTVYFVGSQQEIRSKAAPATKLSFTPATITKLPDEQFSINVQIDTGENSVAAAKLSISFDATKLEAMSITNGPLAPKISASGVVSSGIATITVSAESTAKPIKGTGIIAVLRMRGKEQTITPAIIKFDQTTFVSGLGESQINVLTTIGVASITITGSSQVVATLSPTPAASPTPTASPTPEEQATPSAQTLNQTTDGMGGVGGNEMPISGSPLPVILSLMIGFICMIIGGVIRFAPVKNI
ncbi:MAG: cohesin domain-containing protein [Candidatus Gottesmanbacteria bacterium]